MPDDDPGLQSLRAALAELEAERDRLAAKFDTRIEATRKAIAEREEALKPPPAKRAAAKRAAAKRAPARRRSVDKSG
jgi:hypothetical protein